MGPKLEVTLFLEKNAPDVGQLPDPFDIMHNEAPHPADAVNAVQRTEDQQKLIELLRERSGEEWAALSRELILRADDAPRRMVLDMLDGEGRLDELRDLATECTRVARKAPLFYLWLTRRRARGETEHIEAVEAVPPIDLFRRCVSLLNEVSLKAEDENDLGMELFLKRMRQHSGTKPFTLLDQVTASASEADSRDLYHQIEASRGYSNSIKQRMLAFILRQFPTLLSSEARRDAVPATSEQSDTIYTTEEGMMKKRRELEEIRNEKLPAIFKAIGDAAALGDLSENAEFTSAIEERENLNRRAIELQTQLDKAERIDLTQAGTDRVSLGSRVTLKQLKNDKIVTYSLLGPWDGDPEHGVVSYMSPLGRALMDLAEGDEFEVQLPGGTEKYRVERIGLHLEVGQASSE